MRTKTDKINVATEIGKQTWDIHGLNIKANRSFFAYIKSRKSARKTVGHLDNKKIKSIKANMEIEKLYEFFASVCTTKDKADSYAWPDFSGGWRTVTELSGF